MGRLLVEIIVSNVGGLCIHKCGGLLKVTLFLNQLQNLCESFANFFESCTDLFKVGELRTNLGILKIGLRHSRIYKKHLKWWQTCKVGGN